MKQLWSSLNPNIRYAAYVTAAFVLWMMTGIFSSSDATPVPETEKPRQVRIQPLTQQPYQRIVTLMGRTQADTLATVAAEVDGTIESLTADNGDTVAAGAPLAQINLGSRPARLAEAKARQKEAELLLNAGRKLNKEGFQADTQLATRQAELAAAKAALAQMEKEIADSTVKSPIAGRVENRHVNVGDFVSVGTPLFEVITLDKVKLIGYVAQTQRNLLTIGQDAMGLTVDGQSVHGTVTFVADNTSGRAKTYLVEVTVDAEQAPLLKSGMTVEIRIPTTVRTAHFVPHAALVLNDTGDLGVMAAEEGKARFYKITPLSDAEDGIWVNGLPDKVDLIVTGQATLVDGVTVTSQLKPGVASGERT